LTISSLALKNPPARSRFRVLIAGSGGADGGADYIAI
jgi:hypothetical protein